MAEWSKALHLLHEFFCEADPWVKSSNPNEAIKTTFFSHFLCLVNKERTIENIKFHKQRRTSKQKKMKTYSSKILHDVFGYRNVTPYLLRFFFLHTFILFVMIMHDKYICLPAYK